MVNVNFVAVQLLFMGVLFVSQSQSSEHAQKWATVVARYVVYLLTARGLQEACDILLSSLSTKKLSFSKVVEDNRLSWMVYGASSAVLVTSGQRILNDDFPLLLAAYLICTYLRMEQTPAPTINYGTGMACSFFEGYLALVIPSDGAHCDNFVDKIRKLENSQGVVFPVKKLLLVVTKSLFCPPDLKHFNKPDRPDLPQIEACNSPEELCRDVAGVKRRRYRNTAYKISWPDRSHPTVYVTAECATPLHTLFNVLQKRNLYRELCDANVPELVSDFCTQLKNIISRSPDCHDKCELVHFDDTPDSDEYLPMVLLQKVQELEPRYKDIIARHAESMEDIPENGLLISDPIILPTPRLS